MNDLDRAIVAAAEERDRAAAKAGWLRETAPDRLSAHGDRHELLRIVRDQEARIDALEAEAEYAVGALNDPEILGAIAKGRLKAVLGWDTADRADADAAARATSGKWGG